MGRYLLAYQDGSWRAKTATSTVQSQFQIIKVKNKVAFRNVLGKFLAATPDLSLEWNRDKADSWEQYTMEQKDDKVVFKVRAPRRGWGKGGNCVGTQRSKGACEFFSK